MGSKPLFAEVTVTLKPEVLDPEARAIFSKIDQETPSQLLAVDTARVFKLSLDESSFAGDKEKAKKFVDDVCARLLVNPVSESYSVRIYDSPGDA